MSLKSFFLFCLLAGLWFPTCAQTLPAGPKMPSIGGGLPKGISANGLEALATKSEIPYLEELRQVQGLKKSYDSLRSEVKKLKKATQDSTTQDSVVSVLKAKGKEVLDQEAEVLQSMLEEQEIPGEELRSAVNRTLEGVEGSKAKLAQVSDLDGLDGILDQSEENLKALVNEWLMPKIEQTLSGTLSEGWNPAEAKIPDFYGKDGLEKLLREGAEPQELMAQAKEQAAGKARHISTEYIQKAEGEFSKLKLDSLGNVQVLLDQEKRKFQLVESNELKGAGVLERTGLLLWYDPLTSFEEGFFAEGGLSYGFTHQFQAFGVWTVKRSSDNASGPQITGQGPKLGLRFSKGNWGVQSSVSNNQISTEYPAGYESRNFSGKAWAGELSLVRTIPMGKVIRSVVMVSWDPLYKEDRSLARSAVQLKIGFELGRFKNLFENVSFRQTEENRGEFIARQIN
ncbi:hypothetical protein [Algoriphagus confluentis]|uniref:Uncharacterized protein n=1 Tax=Algoriphagus confluentis TaxID=1697556 RepID=A0ABQ6PIW7_9BACT|nr:hypothetical protein Aconfl_05330 [Algoriphagus confluentis]